MEIISLSVKWPSTGASPQSWGRNCIDRPHSPRCLLGPRIQKQGQLALMTNWLAHCLPALKLDPSKWGHLLLAIRFPHSCFLLSEDRTLGSSLLDQ